MNDVFLKGAHMKIATHYNMARIAVNRLHNSMEDRLHYGLRAKFFCIGAILPDLTPNSLIHRHFYALSGNYVEKDCSNWLKKLAVAGLKH